MFRCWLLQITDEPTTSCRSANPPSYYPCGDWIKNAIWFFDGIALLVPNYIKQGPEQLDRSIVVELKEKGVLEIIEPEKAGDKAATGRLATAMTDIITSKGFSTAYGLCELLFFSFSLAEL